MCSMSFPVTPTTEGEGGYVFTSVCLFVCLFVYRISQKVVDGSDEILWTGSVCDEDELFRFW